MVLGSAGKSRSHLGRLLANAWHPESHVSLALKVSRFDIKATDHAHHAIELAEICLGEVGNSILVRLGTVIHDEGSIRSQKSKGVLRVRHGSNLSAQGSPDPSVSYNGFRISP